MECNYLGHCIPHMHTSQSLRAPVPGVPWHPPKYGRQVSTFACPAEQKNAKVQLGAPVQLDMAKGDPHVNDKLCRICLTSSVGMETQEFSARPLPSES